MIKVGDTVKVIGTTLCGTEETECIPIGTICDVVGTEVHKECILIGIVPKDNPYYGEYWYLESDVEKGHLEWVKEN